MKIGGRNSNSRNNASVLKCNLKVVNLEQK